MDFDLSGLKPLDTSGLSELNTDGLKPLDVSGLTPVEEEKQYPGIGRFAAMAEAQKGSDSEAVTNFAKEGAKGAGSIVTGVMQAPGLIGADQALTDLALLDRIEAKDPNLIIKPNADGSQFTIFDKSQKTEGLSGPALTITKGNPVYDYMTDPSQREQIRADLSKYSDPRTSSLFRGGAEFEQGMEKALPTSPEYKASIPGMIGQGLGSTLGFGVGGLGLKAVKVPTLLSTAGLGAMVEGSQQFNQAIQKGASVETAVHVGMLGMGIGTTEALPIEQFLGRLDKLSGGAVRTAIVNAAKSAGEEGAQEALQTTLENLVTKYNVDPNQEILQGTGTSGGVGAAVGGPVAFIATLLFGKHATSITPPPPEGGASEAPSAVPGAPPPSASGSGQAQPNVAPGGATAPAQKPPGIRETAAAAPPEITPGDVASPLSTTLIAEGKKVVSDALATSKADEVLTQRALPATGSEVNVSYPDGHTVQAKVVDVVDNKAPERPGPEWRPVYDSAGLNQQVGWANPRTGEEQQFPASAGGVNLRTPDGQEFHLGFEAINAPGEVQISAAPRTEEQTKAPESITQKTQETAPLTAETAPESIAPAPLDTTGLISIDEAYGTPTQEVANAQENPIRVPGQIEVRQEPQQVQPQQGGGGEAAQAGRILQSPEAAGNIQQVAEPAPQAALREKMKAKRAAQPPEPAAQVALKEKLRARRAAAAQPVPVTVQPAEPQPTHAIPAQPALSPQDRLKAKLAEKRQAAAASTPAQDALKAKLAERRAAQANVTKAAEPATPAEPVAPSTPQEQLKARAQTKPAKKLKSVSETQRESAQEIMQGRRLDSLSPTERDELSRAINTRDAKLQSRLDEIGYTAKAGFVRNETGDVGPEEFKFEDMFDVAKASIVGANSVDAGQQAAAWVVSRGKESGYEYSAVIDATGKLISAGTLNMTDLVSVGERAVDVVFDPKQTVIMHHNHPQSMGLSDRDITVLAIEGIGSIVANSHDGTFSAALLTSDGRMLSQVQGIDRFEKILSNMANRAFHSLNRLMVNEVRAQNAMPWVLARLGLIEYHTSIPKPLGSGLIERVTEQLKQELRDAGYRFQDSPSRDADRSTVHHSAAEGLAAVSRRNEEIAAIKRGVQPGDATRSERGGLENGGREGPGAGNESRSTAARRRLGITGQVAGEESRDALPRARDLGDNPGAPNTDASDSLLTDNIGLLEALETGKIKAAFDSFRTAVQDRFLPLLRIQQAIEKIKETSISDEENAYLIEEGFSGRAGERLQQFEIKFKKPLLEAIHKSKLSLAQVEDYLYARHAPERNAAIAKINPEMQDGGSGMKDADAKAIIDKAAADGTKAKLDEIAALHDAIHKQAMDIRVEFGLLSKEDADAWRKTYSYYTPLRGRGDIEENNIDGRPNQGKGYQVKGPESRRALGRISKAKDLLAHTLMQAEEAIIRGEKNRVGQSLMKLAESNPDPDVWQVNPIETMRRINPTTGQVEDFSGVDRNDPNVLVIKKEGKQFRLWIANERLARNLKNLDADKVGLVVRMLMRVNRYFSAVNTGLSPEFLVTNAFRDVQAGALNLSQYGMKGLIADTLLHYPQALKASWGGVRGKANTEWQQHFREYAGSGGKVSFFKIDDLNQQRAQLERDLKYARGERTVRKVGATVLKYIEDANSAVDNAVRLSAYVAARKRGMTRLKAASLAKNLTVNFNRRGELGPQLNALYLFFNASIQGTAVLGKLATTRRGRRMIYAMIAMGFVSEMLNAMLSPPDDDKQKKYDKISDFDKSRNIIIMLPNGMKADNLKVPMPYGFNAFFDFGRNIAAYARGFQSAPKTLSNSASTFADSFNPIGGTNSLLNFLAPTILDPFVDLAQNRDFADRPIMPEQDPYGPEKPDSQRYWGSVTSVDRHIAEELNAMTGGNHFKPGAIDVSPETLDHFASFIGGSLGSFIKRSAVDLAYKAHDNEPITASDIPFVRKVAAERAPEQDVSVFYDRAGEISALEAEIKGLAREHGQTKAREVVAENRGALSLLKFQKKAREKLTDIRHAIETVKSDEKLSFEERTKRLDRLTTLRTKIVTRFNSLYNERVVQPQQEKRAWIDLDEELPK